MATKKKDDERVTHTKAQIIASEKYKRYRDVLAVILPDRDLTAEEVDAAIDKFMKGKVK